MSEMYDAIRALCRSRGINVTQLCRELGIPRSTLSELSTGRTRQLGLRHATRIAEYFGVPVSALTGAEAPAPAPDVAALDDKADIATLIRLRAEINRGRR